MEQKESEANVTAADDASSSKDQQELNIWMRGVLMIVYAVLLRLSEFAIIVVMIPQFCIKAATKKTHPRLTDFGESLSLYVQSIARFQTFNSEERPYPFGADWPKVDRSADDSSGDGVPPTQAQAS